MESNYSVLYKNSSDDVYMAEPFILTMFKDSKQSGNGSVDFVALMKALEDWRYKLNLTWVSQDASCNYYCSGRLREVILAYNSIHGYISLLVCMFGSLANILNVAVLTRRDLAATPINRLLKWLAVADVFVMLEYVPFASYKYFILPGQMDFPYSWAAYMLFHMHFAQLLHTTSICLTISLAVWRYIAINYPERSHVLCTERRCSLAIVSSFILPPILCTPAFMVFKIRTTVIIENATPSLLYHLDSDPDGTLYQVNFWIHAVIIKLLPCFILTVISSWLIRALNQATRRKQALKTYDSCSAGANGVTNTVIISRRQKKSERRRDRTTKMLLAVLWLFLITEFPQGVLGLLSGILGKCFFKKCYNLFGELMDILALMNGSINFILYCSMSRQFRMTFGHIFINRMLAKWPAGSQTDMQSTGRSSIP